MQWKNYHQTKIKWFLFTNKFVWIVFILLSSACFFFSSRFVPFLFQAIRTRTIAVRKCNKKMKLSEKCVENRSIWHANRRRFLNSMQMFFFRLIRPNYGSAQCFTMLNSFIVSICWLSVAWSVVQKLLLYAYFSFWSIDWGAC